MKNLILSSVLVLIASSAAQAQQAVQWKVSDGGNGNWYRLFVTGPITFWDSRDRALLVGGHLATLGQAKEDAWVCARGWTQVAWIGGYKPQGSDWIWLDGTAWGYTRWNVCEPNDGSGELALMCPLHCGVSQGCGSGGGWYDYGPVVHAAFVTGYLVEWSADCNADGIVDYGQILDGTFPDANGDGVPDCCDGGGSCTPCPGDVASDGMVDGVDLAAVLSQWGTQGSGTFNADIDGSGLVDGGDLALVLGGWGPCPQ
jgi:hypothetical protein